jgi:hypothetical protein
MLGKNIFIIEEYKIWCINIKIDQFENRENMYGDECRRVDDSIKA